MISIGDMLFVVVLVYIVSKTTSKLLTFIPSGLDPSFPFWWKCDKGENEE